MILCHINCNKWEKVFKNGPSKIYARQSLKNLKGFDFKFLKGCLLQILLGPFLNTLSQMLHNLRSPFSSDDKSFPPIFPFFFFGGRDRNEMKSE